MPLIQDKKRGLFINFTISFVLAVFLLNMSFVYMFLFLPFNASAGEQNPDTDGFGGVILVKKYIDADGSAATDGDRELASSTQWEFTLTQGTSTITQETIDGKTTFSGLKAGQYTLAERPQAGYAPLLPATGSSTFMLAQGAELTMVFVNYRPETPPVETPGGLITVKKYIDSDGLASTTGDRELATSSPWEFTLQHGATSTVQSTVNGQTSFDMLTAGTYNIFETPKPGFAPLDPGNGSTTIILAQGGEAAIKFVNYQTKEVPLGSITVRKFKDTDGLASTTADRSLVSNVWQFKLTGAATSTKNTVNGTAVFDKLPPGDYTVTETLLSGWTRVDPANGIATTSLLEGENVTLDFANFEKPTENGGGGSSGGGGGSSGGGGGGGGLPPDEISTPQIAETGCDFAMVSWTTTRMSSSRVVYDNVSHSDLSGTSAPDYGYAHSTVEDTAAVTSHDISIIGLSPGTIYYMRPISTDGSTQIGNEIAFLTSPVSECVAGEEGAPILTIEKSASPTNLDAGASTVFTVKVSNIGNLTAFNVTLHDVLPDMLTFADTKGAIKDIPLGDIAPDGSKTVTLDAIVSKDAKAGNYVNVATAQADNNGPVSDTASVTVRESQVLAETGFSKIEFIGLLGAIVAAAGAAFGLKRKLTTLSGISIW